MSRPWSIKQRHAIYTGFWANVPVPCPDCGTALELTSRPDDEDRTIITAICPQCGSREESLDSKGDPLADQFHNWTDEEARLAYPGGCASGATVPCPIDGAFLETGEMGVARCWVHCPRCGNIALL